jgi:hypothetical protein
VGRFFSTPHDNRPEFVLSITTYLDETKHTAIDEHVAVGGFYGTEAQWKSIADPWKEALRNRRALHMNQLRWNSKHSERRIQPLLSRLGTVPHNLGLRPVYAAVKVSDYADLIANARKHDGKVILCGYILCLSVVLSWLTDRLPSHAVVKIVCERQDEYALRAKALFDATAKRTARDPQNPYFNSIEFIEKDSSVATQPADFLAFAVGKHLDEQGSKKDLWCTPIFGGNDARKIGYVYTRDKVRGTVRKIQKGTDALIARGVFV